MESVPGEHTHVSPHAFASNRLRQDVVGVRDGGVSFWLFCWEWPLWKHKKRGLTADIRKFYYIRSAMRSGGRGFARDEVKILYIAPTTSLVLKSAAREKMSL